MGHGVYRARVGDLDMLARDGAHAAHREAANGLGRTPLIEAAACGQLAAVRILLEQGALIDARERVWQMDRQRWVAAGTALSAALEGNHSDLALELLSRGANFELRDAVGLTPLMLAAAAGSVQIVRLLIAKGADLEAEKQDAEQGRGVPAVHAGVQHLEVVRVLLDAGSEIDCVGAYKRTLVQHAVSTRAPADVLRLLLSRGAPMPTLGSAIHAPELIKVLLESGASLTARDKSNKTALDHARNWRASKTRPPTASR